MSKIRAICIKPGSIPIPAYIENDLLEMARLVNIDKNGNPCKEIESFEISEIRDNINVISSPKGKERSLPVVRNIGNHIKLYGLVYIVKMDDAYNFIDLTSKELTDYCVKFLNENITLEELGYETSFAALDDEDDYTPDISSKKDSNYGRADFWIDEW